MKYNHRDFSEETLKSLRQEAVDLADSGILLTMEEWSIEDIIKRCDEFLSDKAEARKCGGVPQP